MSVVKSRSLIHCGLHPECGICSDTIAVQERVIALYGGSDDIEGFVRPFSFPAFGNVKASVGPFALCRYPKCRRCGAIEFEFIPIHVECLEVILSVCRYVSPDFYSRLWSLATARWPWKRAQPVLCVSAYDDASHLNGLRKISPTCDLHGLCRLPVELLVRIRAYSPHACLWRVISAFTMASRASQLRRSKLRTSPMTDIASWNRGEEPLLRALEPRPAARMRLEIDGYGIRKIETLSSESTHPSEDSDRLAFIVIAQDDVSKVTALFKDGLLRLKLSSGLRDLPIWNTPNPMTERMISHQDMRSTLAGRCLDAMCRYHVVHLDRIYGITFFISQKHLYGMHVHRSYESCAIAAYERISKRRQQHTAWVFWPIARNDRVLAFAVRRHPFAILASMELAGLVILGDPGTTGAVCLTRSAPGSFVYGEPMEGCAIEVLQEYPAQEGSPNLSCFGDEETVVAIPRHLGNELGICFSSAPLAGLSSAEVFYDNAGEYCQGILFRYENKAYRAVGQCRSHVDPSRRFVQPIKMFYNNFQITRHSAAQRVVQLRFDVRTIGQDGEEQSKEGGREQPHYQSWRPCALTGLLKFWFSATMAFVQIST